VERLRAYRFELDPNNHVRTLLHKHSGAARFAYNWSLGRRIERFKTAEGKEKFTNAMAEYKVLSAIKDATFPWLHEVSKCAPQEAIRDLDEAFTNFWKRRKDGVGFPKFKKKNRSKDSFRLYGSIKPQDRYIQLPRIGVVRLKERIRGRIRGRVLSATVSRVADRWFVSLQTTEEVEQPVAIEGPCAGIDFGITTFATVSSGAELKKVDGPNALKHHLAALRRAQQSHSRKRKGSNNRRKSAQRLARMHARIANIRRDAIHHFTTPLAKTKSVIVVEDLNVRGMARHRNLARSVLDQGWSEARRQLEYKTLWHGSKLVVADRFFPSSKLCSNCGRKTSSLPLSVREWTCDGCGMQHDRDENAAKNLEMYPECQGNLTPVESPLTAERRRRRSTSHGSLKQEADCEVIRVSSEKLVCQ
jgi:putative transposase